MKVSIKWLEQFVDLNTSIDELIRLLPLRTIGTKEVTDNFIELDMKGYNRADLLSMRGLAYEVAAITGSNVSFNEPEEAKFAWNEATLPKLQVTIEDPNLCQIYCLAKIENLRVERSNPEWVKKLNDSGMRSVNNIADITNLVMLEYGQPLHAFDASKVSGEIIVRMAKPGEKITTLDGKTRELNSNNLLIADQEKALGIAGVMGGQNSEVTDTTTTVLLEAAIFDPINIRKTVNQLGLPSEASKRFQHGLTKKRLLQALDATIKMYQNLGGKLTEITLIGDFKDQTTIITLTQDQVNSLIGIEIPAEQIKDYLKKLHFKLDELKFLPSISNNKLNEKAWEVEVPYWRLDIQIAQDLIEEVARMYGYEKIPAKQLPGTHPDQIDQALFNFTSKVRDNLIAEGLTEVQTYSFYSTQVLKNLGWYQDNNLQYLVKIANPISAETEYLRLNIWPNLVEVVDKNLRQRFDDIAIFEIGKAYTPSKETLPKEEYRLSLALMNNTDNPVEELIALTKELFNKLNLKFKMIENDLQGPSANLFHPTRHAAIFINDEQIGGLAEVHPKLANQFGIEKRVAIMEISLLQTE